MPEQNIDAQAYQAPLPQNIEEYPRGGYDRFPTFPLKDDEIASGYNPLAERIADDLQHGLRVLAIDGFHGVNWTVLRTQLTTALKKYEFDVEWFDISQYLASKQEIDARCEPFMGGDDAIFGTHFPFGPEVFFDARKLAECRIQASISRGNAPGKALIFYGIGASLIEQFDRLWYADFPKDFLQERARSGELTNLGDEKARAFSEFYKRAYFVEWPALNRLFWMPIRYRSNRLMWY